LALGGEPLAKSTPAAAQNQADKASPNRPADTQPPTAGASFPPLNPGTSWNVPRVSLPSLFGMQPRFQIEWWYYVGSAYDTRRQVFSLHLEILRASLGGLFQVGYGITGIGWNDGGESHYVSGLGFGFGAAETALVQSSLTVPPVSDSAFSASMVPLLEIVNRTSKIADDIHVNFPFPANWDGWKFEYLDSRSSGNPVGTAGSVYSVRAHGRGYQTSAHKAGTSKSEYRIALTVEDKRGMMMEGVSGYVGPDMFPNAKPDAPASYECAQPLLKIQSGSTLTLDGENHPIETGYLWLDRQMIAGVQGIPSAVSAVPRTAEELKQALIQSTPSPKSLYLGDWMAFVLDNGLSMVLAEFWKPSDPQWITGTRVGRPPRQGFGNLYYHTGDSTRGNGGRFLRARLSRDSKDWDYDVNILWPDTPETSPHWRSPLTGHTYATAWQIDFAPALAEHGLPATLYVYAISENCEIIIIDAAGAFYEGAALVYADRERTTLLGHVFVEQMGFN